MNAVEYRTDVDDRLNAAGCPPLLIRELFGKVARCFGPEWEGLSETQQLSLVRATVWGIVEHNILQIADAELKSAFRNTDVKRFDWTQVRARVAECSAASAGITRALLSEMDRVLVIAREDFREIQEARTRLHYLLNVAEREGLASVNQPNTETALLGVPSANAAALGTMIFELTRAWNNVLHLLRKCGIWETSWDEKLRSEMAFVEGIAFFRSVESVVAGLSESDYPEVATVRRMLRPSLHQIDPGVSDLLAKQMRWKAAV